MKAYTGFIAPIDDGTHWKLGVSGLPYVTLQSDGDWTADLTIGEYQNKRGIETYNCVGFNTLKCIQELIWKQYGIKVNFSDRWVGIIAGTSAEKGGNDPHTVAEAIRKNGLIPEEMLPFSDDLKDAQEYYSFKGADEKACREEGKKWLETYGFGHEDVFTPSQPKDEKINNMMVALKSSPLGISVYAWTTNDKGIYISIGQPNHWTSVRNQKDITGVFDSYDPFLKSVDQDYLYCKRYSITKKKVELPQEQVSRFQRIINAIKEALGLVQKQVDNLKVKDTYQEVKDAVKNSNSNLLVIFCNAIQVFEEYKPGSQSYRTNNPGNIKDKNGKFLVFDTYEKGFAYLTDYVYRACTGKHASYKPEMTINQFFHIYTGDKEPVPTNYATFVALECGLSIGSEIKNLI